ncbi:MAG: type I restriction endonuclease subunit R, partial [Chloroflexi bacterium]|nr:type I restriction endonuclease subunit R [Chloroflexota bacterium]
MSPVILDESAVEDRLLAWLGDLGYAVARGTDLSPGGAAPERESYAQTVLVGRLRAAMDRLNPVLPEVARDAALRAVLDLGGPSLVADNRAMHRLLVEGVPVSYQQQDGREVGGRAALVDWGRPERNDWLAVNQFTVEERPRPGEPPSRRRPDVVVFLNGLPIAVIELKNPLDTEATIWAAYDQLQTYKREIPSLFR